MSDERRVQVIPAANATARAAIVNVLLGLITRNSLLITHYSLLITQLLITRYSSRKRERVEHSPARGRLRQIAHGVDESEGGGAVARIELSGDDRAGPAADAGENRDVLFAVGAAEGDRLSDDSGTALEPPQQLSRLRVDGLEPSIHRSVERDVAGRDERAAPHRKLLFDRPDRALVDRVPRVEHATIAARPRVHLHVRADVRRARNVVGLHALFVFAEICVRDVEQTRQRGERRGLPVFRAGRGRTDVVNDVSESRRLLFDRDQTAGAQIDAAADRVVVERRCGEDLSVRPIHDVDVAVALRAQSYFSYFSVDRQVDEDLFVDAVVVVEIVRAPLIEPDRLAGVGFAREDTARPLVVAGPHFRIPRTGIRGAVINQIELGVIRDPTPNRAAADFPHVGRP